jgi:hypothetical protein
VERTVSARVCSWDGGLGRGTERAKENRTTVSGI